MKQNCTSLLDPGSGTEEQNDAFLLLVLGLSATLAGSLLNTTGSLLMKLAQDKNGRRVEGGRSPQWNGMVCNITWLGGIAAMMVALPLEAVAITLASQSIVATTAGLGIILTLVVGPKLLGETVSRADWVASTVILCGTMMCALFGAQSTATYDTHFLLDRWSSATMIVNSCVWVSSMAGIALLERAGKLKGHRWRCGRSVLWGYMAGSQAGFLNILFKGTGEMLQSDSVGEHPVIFAGSALLTISVAVAQMVLMNMGLERFPGTLSHSRAVESFRCAL
jgi:multidrug transporter EmrE-like cation transporter